MERVSDPSADTTRTDQLTPTSRLDVDHGITIEVVHLPAGNPLRALCLCGWRSAIAGSRPGALELGTEHMRATRDQVDRLDLSGWSDAQIIDELERRARIALQEIEQMKLGRHLAIDCAPWCVNRHDPDSGCDGLLCYREPELATLATGHKRSADPNGKPRDLQVYVWPGRELVRDFRGRGLPPGEHTVVKLAVGLEGWDFEPVAELSLDQARLLQRRLTESIADAVEDQVRVDAAGGRVVGSQS